MGNQCCSQAPNESNQVVTTATRDVQKPADQEVSGKKTVASFKNPEQESEDRNGTSSPDEKKVNVYEHNQDEHYPSKTVAVEVDSLPPSDNLGS